MVKTIIQYIVVVRNRNHKMMCIGGLNFRKLKDDLLKKETQHDESHTIYVYIYSVS